MIANVEVDVALARPPRADATVFVTVAVDLDERLNLAQALSRADAQARELACQIASCHPRVVMPIAARITDYVEV